MKKKITVGVLALVMTSGVALAHGPHGGGKMMPRNSDGVVTKENMEQRQAERFARMDTDGDGRLSVDELHAGLQRERSERMHKWLDRDGDGFVSAEELAAMQNKRFAKMDANGDGVLDKDEMRSSRRDMKDRAVRGQKTTQ
jgi:Ca2+-binding EF-hand superfamily protein